MRRFIAIVAITILSTTACGQPRPEEPPARYPLTGQVLAVLPETRELTVKHGDIEGFMPAMTMTFPVGTTSDLEGREPGDLISATLEVSDSQGRLVDVVKTGTAPLPTNTNEVALASGVLDVGDVVPDAALIDQADKRRSLAEWRGTPTVVSFSYTTCPIPTYCPQMDRNLASLQRIIAGDPGLAGRVRLISITIDPATDTPAVLAAHATRLQADPAVWTFLTGDAVTVDRVAGRFGVGIVRPDAPGEISHNLRTTLVGADGRVSAIYTGNEWTPEEVARDIRAAVAASR